MSACCCHSKIGKIFFFLVQIKSVIVRVYKQVLFAVANECLPVNLTYHLKYHLITCRASSSAPSQLHPAVQHDGGEEGDGGGSGERGTAGSVTGRRRKEEHRI